MHELCLKYVTNDIGSSLIGRPVEREIYCISPMCYS